jgi:hypothetical protein
MVLRPWRSACSTVLRPRLTADSTVLRPFDDHRLDRIQAASTTVSTVFRPPSTTSSTSCGPFDNVFDGLAAAEDRVFHRARHQASPYSALRPQAQAQS